MHLIRVATVALNQTPLDWGGNLARTREGLNQARAAGASVVCLPELGLTGYGCEDAFFSGEVRERAWAMLEELLPDTRGMIACFGLPVTFRNQLYNAAALAVDGVLVGVVGKQHLANEGIHYEPRWFRPWPPGRVERLVRDGQAWPLGDLVFDCGGVRIGFEICRDAWVAQRTGAGLAARGADIVLNPSASHFAFGKHAIRERFVREGARAFGVTYLYTNLLGNEAGRAIFDGGGMIASGGKLVGCGERLRFEEVQVVTATVDLDATRLLQSRMFAEAVPPEDASVVSVDFDWPETSGAPSPEAGPTGWERSPDLKQEEFTRAVALGLFDYLRKSRSRGFVVSLSGGADSSAVACLCAIMVRLGMEQLGPDRLAARLGADPAVAPARAEAWVRRLLLCAYQSTRNSSETTREAAREVAAALGAEFVHLDVDPMREAYEKAVQDVLGRPLAWETDDLALQNVQARVRVPAVWMLANLRQALLLSTSNRSEAAVGYATMDGDTAGGLSPIAGIDKHFLRQWLAWLRDTGPLGLGPVPALEAVTAQAPTAELRPPGSGQTDEADLMPYPVLDFIERAAIRDKLSPREVFQRLAHEYPGDPSADRLRWVERFFTLWSRNQWKRERYAPSFHLDDANLDPKTWCRFPILSGGYERELRELRGEVGCDQ